jgi:hypothetical protein
MAITKIQTGGIPALAVTHDKLHTDMDLSTKTVTLPTLTALDVTNNIVVGGTVDGIDIAARDAVLTSTTTTATAALPKAGGTMTGLLSIQADANARSIRIIGRSDDYGEMDFYENDNSTILARIQTHNTMFNIRAYSVPMNFQQAGNTKMTLLANGNVGIGTANPDTLLHVNGQAKFENNVTLNENTPALVIPNGDFRIFTGGGEKVRIDSSGRVHIGQTATTTSGDTYALEINGANPAVLGLTGKTNGTGQIVGLNFNQRLTHAGSPHDSRYGGAIKSIATDTYTAGNGATYDSDLVLYSALAGAHNEGLRITSDARGLSEFTAKAWIEFNGNNTVSITNSHNFSSIADEGVGQYRLNFSNNMANTNYCINTHDDSWGNGWSDSQATSYYKVKRRNQADGAYQDVPSIWSLVFGD